MHVSFSGEIQKKLTVKLPLILNYKSKWIEINEHWQITTFHPCLTGLSEEKKTQLTLIV